MEHITLPPLRLVGISLGRKTTNENGQSNQDCGALWQRFEEGNYSQRIADRITDAVYAVYFNYDGDHTQPFEYFIGHAVTDQAPVPEGMDDLSIPGQKYLKLTARGEIPASIANAWRSIWKGDIDRAYGFDIEIYDERSQNWKAAEVDVLVSVLPG